LVFVVVMASTDAASQARTSVRSAPLAPRQGVLLGAYVDTTGRWVDDATAEAGVSHFESAIGRTLSIDHHYYAWTDSFPTGLERWDAAHGRTPMISWSGTSLGPILSGRYDAMIRQRAEDVRAFGSPVFLRWGWEMNGNWSSDDGSHNNDPGTTNGPQKYIAAWRHIHDIFTSVGATNAVWVWSPNATDVPDASWNHWTRYYPGNAYVDWIGIDGYNWGTSRPWSSWTSFAHLVQPIYSTYAGRKPIMVAETGSAEHGGSKAAWFSSIGKVLPTRFPAIAALVYFDADKEVNWTVQSSAAALASFRALANHRYFVQRSTVRFPRRKPSRHRRSVSTGPVGGPFGIQ
jgi:hypothetical protein